MFVTEAGKVAETRLLAEATLTSLEKAFGPMMETNTGTLNEVGEAPVKPVNVITPALVEYVSVVWANEIDGNESRLMTARHARVDFRIHCIEER